MGGSALPRWECLLGGGSPLLAGIALAHRISWLVLLAGWHPQGGVSVAGDQDQLRLVISRLVPPLCPGHRVGRQAPCPWRLLQPQGRTCHTRSRRGGQWPRSQSSWSAQVLSATPHSSER